MQAMGYPGRMSTILWLKDIQKGDSSIVGEKAAKLSELLKNNFPVPNSFVITTEAFSDYLNENGLANEIFGTIDNIDIEDKSSVQNASNKIQNLIKKIPLSEDFKREILENYEKFNISMDVFKVAKPALELIKAGRDLPYVSIQTSIESPNLMLKNIKGNTNLIGAIQESWASFYNEEAIYNIKKNNLDYEKIALIVAKQINSQKSGFLSTINKQNKDEMSVRAVYGLVEPLASGAINYDVYSINKDNLRPVMKDITKKEYMYSLDFAYGVSMMKSIQLDWQDQQALSDFELRRLAETAVKIEGYYKKPLEIEFAFERNNLYIIDTKEITFDEEKEGKREVIPEIKFFDEKTEIENIQSGIIEPEIETITEIKTVLDSEDNLGNIVPSDGVSLLNEFRTYEDAKRLVSSLDIKPIWYKSTNLKDKLLLRAEFEVIKKLHDEGFTNIGVMLPKITNVNQIKEVKKMLDDVGLKAQTNIDLGIIIDTPAAVQIIKELCEEGIDFVSIDANELIKLTLANDELNEMHPAILRQIKHVVNVCKGYDVETSIYGEITNNQEMIEFLIKTGVDSIAVNPENVNKVRNLAAKTERKLLLNVARKDFYI